MGAGHGYRPGGPIVSPPRSADAPTTTSPFAGIALVLDVVALCATASVGIVTGTWTAFGVAAVCSLGTVAVGLFVDAVRASRRR